MQEPKWRFHTGALLSVMEGTHEVWVKESAVFDQPPIMWFVIRFFFSKLVS